MDNLTSVVSTQVRGEELGRLHIPPDNVSCLHRTPTLGTHQDRSGLIPSCLRYLYEDNLFIGIQRVKLFKYPELGQYRLLALVLTLVLRHSMFVDIILIYLAPQCRVIHFQELVRIASTLPLRAPTFSCIQISVCYILLQSIYATLNFFFSQSAKRKCVEEDGFLCQPTMSSVAVRKESAQQTQFNSLGELSASLLWISVGPISRANLRSTDSCRK